MGGKQEASLSRFESENLEFLLNRQKFILDLNDWELDLLKRFIFFEDLCSGDLSFFFCLEICSWRFVLWRFVQEIFPFEELFYIFFLWRCGHGDFSFEIFILGDLSFLKNVLGGLPFWNLFRRFVLLKIFLGDLSFEKFVRRFVLLKIEVQEIFPLLISCKKNKSWLLVS